MLVARLKRLIFTFALAISPWICAQDGTDTAANSLEIRVVTSGGFASAYETLAPLFEQQTGMSLQVEYGSSGGGAIDSIPMRLNRNEAFDVVILSQAGLNSLIQQNKVIRDSAVDLVYSKIGMAVREGRAVPDISTPQAFRATLLAAESIAYSASVSGTYLAETLWPAMGIWEQLQGKSTRILSERVGSVIARDEADLGFQQISELLPIEGIVFVGPIPDEYQLVSTFSAGIVQTSENKDAAEKLLGFLSSRQAAPLIEAQGLEAVISTTAQSRSGNF